MLLLWATARAHGWTLSCTNSTIWWLALWRPCFLPSLQCSDLNAEASLWPVQICKVKNVANFGRLQEECDVMSLVLAACQEQVASRYNAIDGHRHRVREEWAWFDTWICFFCLCVCVFECAFNIMVFWADDSEQTYSLALIVNLDVHVISRAGMAHTCPHTIIQSSCQCMPLHACR